MSDIRLSSCGLYFIYKAAKPHTIGIGSTFKRFWSRLWHLLLKSCTIHLYCYLQCSKRTDPFQLLLGKRDSCMMGGGEDGISILDTDRRYPAPPTTQVKEVWYTTDYGRSESISRHSKDRLPPPLMYNLHSSILNSHVLINQWIQNGRTTKHTKNWSIRFIFSTYL